MPPFLRSVRGCGAFWAVNSSSMRRASRHLFQVQGKEAADRNRANLAYGGERLSQRRDERQDHNPDKDMERRIHQIDCREENAQSTVSCTERGSERSRENQKERLQYLTAGTEETTALQKAGYGAITDKAAGLSILINVACFSVLFAR